MSSSTTEFETAVLSNPLVRAVWLEWERLDLLSDCPHRSMQDAIDTLPTTATAVGIRPSAETVEVYAPFGLDDLLSGTIRANRKQITREIFEAKVLKWLTRWASDTAAEKYEYKADCM